MRHIISQFSYRDSWAFGLFWNNVFIPGGKSGTVMHSYNQYMLVYGDSLVVVFTGRLFSKSALPSLVVCLKDLLGSHCMLKIGQK